MNTGPLAGIKVIDQTQALAGPYCAMMLGDLGADVTKIERPGVGDQSRQWGPPYIGDQSTYYLAANRNKRGIVLDHKSEDGRTVLKRLAARAEAAAVGLGEAEGLDGGMSHAGGGVGWNRNRAARTYERPAIWMRLGR